jgi:hypothetical protein
LGLWKIKFETAAYNAIKAEYEAEDLFENAKSQDVKTKRQLNYEIKFLETQKAIKL